jgi:hypothetical protein
MLTALLLSLALEVPPPVTPVSTRMVMVLRVAGAVTAAVGTAGFGVVVAAAAATAGFGVAAFSQTRRPSAAETSQEYEARQARAQVFDGLALAAMVLAGVVGCVTLPLMGVGWGMLVSALLA